MTDAIEGVSREREDETLAAITKTLARQNERIHRLERVAHPPIDLTPAIISVLEEHGGQILSALHSGKGEGEALRAVIADAIFRNTGCSEKARDQAADVVVEIVEQALAAAPVQQSLAGEREVAALAIINERRRYSGLPLIPGLHALEPHQKRDELRIADAVLAALASQPSAGAFLDAILRATPNGESIEVKYHPNGDWSVYDTPAPLAQPPATEVGERQQVAALLDKLAGDYDPPPEVGGLIERNDDAANLGHLIGLLRREGQHSGVWFAEHLLAAATALSSLSAQVAGKEAHVPWHSPLGGLLEARRVLQFSHTQVLAERDRNTHLRGVYEPVLSALQPALAELAVLCSPTSQALPGRGAGEGEG